MREVDQFSILDAIFELPRMVKKGASAMGRKSLFEIKLNGFQFTIYGIF